MIRLQEKNSDINMYISGRLIIPISPILPGTRDKQKTGCLATMEAIILGNTPYNCSFKMTSYNNPVKRAVRPTLVEGSSYFSA